MQVISASVKLQLFLVYFDKIVIFLKALEKHIDHVRGMLAMLQSAEITLML